MISCVIKSTLDLIVYTSMHFPTPILGNVAKHNDKVYEPSEDTFILLDAIEKLVLNGTLKNPHTCLEIGSGSGIVTTFISSIFHDKCFCTAIDISGIANLATLSTLQANNSTKYTDIIRADCVSGIIPIEQFDLVVMNPPYVETDPSEISKERIWAGGYMGSSMIHRLLYGTVDENTCNDTSSIINPLLSKLLSRNGKALIVMAACNYPERFLVTNQSELNASIVLKKRCGRELLSVLMFQRA